ncbi:MAG: hypothetical protein PHX70_05605 [Clostridium sp.]|nr:hypothetical protein [Clostridium sp.]
MKNLMTKLLVLSILATVISSSTPAFAATNTSNSKRTVSKICITSKVIAKPMAAKHIQRERGVSANGNVAPQIVPTFPWYKAEPKYVPFGPWCKTVPKYAPLYPW